MQIRIFDFAIWDIYLIILLNLFIKFKILFNQIIIEIETKLNKIKWKKYRMHSCTHLKYYKKKYFFKNKVHEKCKYSGSW